MRGYSLWGPTKPYHASAGVRAWFALADGLRARGFEVDTDHRPLPAGNIAVYCDTTPGDPAHAERKVRWMLYYPDFFGVRTGIGADELVFAWLPAYYPDAVATIQVDIIEHDLFHDRRITSRSGSVWFPGKSALQGVEGFAPPPGAIEVSRRRPCSRYALAMLLRGSEWLYCADVDSHIIPEALLCGCRVMTPRGEVTHIPLPSASDFDAMLDRFITLTQERWV